MSDTNKKNPEGGDWDVAIDEWEKAFVPEVATDKETKKVATLSVIPMVPGEAARAMPAPTITDAPDSGPPSSAIPALKGPGAPIPIINAPNVASRVPRPVSFVPKPLAKQAPPPPKPAPLPPAPSALAPPTPYPSESPPAEAETVDSAAMRPTPLPTAPPTPLPMAAAQPAGDDVDALLGTSNDAKTVVQDRNPVLEAATAERGAARGRLPSAAEELEVSDVELVEPEAPARAADDARVTRDEEDDNEATVARPSPRTAPPAAPPPHVSVPLAPPTRPGFSVEVEGGPRSTNLADLLEPESEAGSVAPPPPSAPEIAPEPPPSVRADFSDIPTQDFVAPPGAKVAGAKRGWLSDESREAFTARAAWLEAEARACEDPTVAARGLLAVSEIKALLGDAGGALELAQAAAAAAPAVVLAHKQARGLRPSDDVAPLVQDLDREASSLEVPAARAHAALFAADLLRLRGDEAGAVLRWEHAASAFEGDVRVGFVRAAHALSKGDLAQAAALRAGADAAPIAKGLGDLLRVRGHEGGGEQGDPLADIEGPLAINDALRLARAALDGGDVAAAVGSFVAVGRQPELKAAAQWVAASLAQTRASTRAGAGRIWAELAQTDPAAIRPLAACAVELGDAALMQGVLNNAAFSIADRAVLATLLDVPHADAEGTLSTLSGSDALAPLASAIAGTRRPDGHGEGDADRQAIVEARAGRVAGNPASRDALRLGRLIATGAAPKVIEAVAAASRTVVEASAVGLEMAVRGHRYGDVSDTVKSWGHPSGSGNDGEAHALLAAALIAERGQDLGRALSAYREARAADPTSETLLRIVASLDPAVEPPGELNQLADDLGATLQGALARLEAVVREREVDDRTRSDLLERAHRAAPDLAIPQLMAEQLARRSGDVEEVLRWIRERRATSSDPVEQALDHVREALLVADTQPEVAAERLEEALKTRPTDAALRELYERLSPAPPPDRAAWREQRAAVATGDAKALYYMEAAHEYERLGDTAQALRAAVAAVQSGDSVLARIARERAEVEGGEPARLADELLSHARATSDPRERREAYERLADLDATARSDTSSAVLWHRSILEEVPDYKPSLRHVEHAFVSAGRDDELEPIATSIARVLSGAGGGEGVAHAAFAARLRSRGEAGDVNATFDLAELAASQADPPLAALRMLYAHARARKDDPLMLKTTLALVERTTRPLEVSALLVRAAETAIRLGDLPNAEALLARAQTEDAADVVTYRLIADVKKKLGKPAEAAEAFESLARTSTVAAHQLAAWYDAASLWQSEVHDDDRAVTAFEQASNLDVTYKDVFSRLLALYTTRGAGGELATLLERRVATITDPKERVAMEVERGRALVGVHDYAGARVALDSALAADPDHTAALAAFGDLCAKQSDWEHAEQAWVRLARLLTNPDEQREVYAHLGELYSTHAENLTRAETAWKEVLKRAPGDVATLERLIDVHKRQNDAGRAAEIVQQLAVQSKDPVERRKRLIELAQIHEDPGKDLRKAEQVLEGARREAPTDVTVLRALAEFYQRHKQLPAFQILLDRAAADARRAFAAGRFAPALFEVMRAVFDLRGKKDAANVVGATLAALEGQPASLRGGELRALDPRLDDLLAPEIVSPSLRALLSKCGDALDAATPFDMRAAQAAPVQGGPLLSLASQLAQAAGLPQPQVFVSPKLPRTCVALGSSPPVLVFGEALAQTTNDRARAFLVARAVKLVRAHASALVRVPATDVVVLVSAWLQTFNPTWVPEGVNAGVLANAVKRIQAGMPADVPADAGVMAMEIAGALGPQMATLGASTLAWANRAALLAIGDPNAALDAVAWTIGKDAAPTDPKERASWIVRTREASDLLAFSVSDAYAEARARLGLDR